MNRMFIKRFFVLYCSPMMIRVMFAVWSVLVTMTNLDQFLNRRRSVKYSCLELADEVWFELTGLHLKKRLKRLTAAFAAATNAVNSSGFELLRTPISPCFVLMQRDKITPHIGIYVDGSIFHLAEHGAEYRPVQIATLGFNKIGYYR